MFNMTMREAKQRLGLYNMTISKREQEFRISFPEDGHKDNERNAYYTDCLEDAVLTGADMRKRRGAIKHVRTV